MADDFNPDLGQPAIPNLGPSSDELLQGMPQLAQQQPQVDPLDQLKSNLIQQYQAVSPRPAQGGRIKQLLSNFLSGGGEAMMKHAGVETPEQAQQRILGNINTVENTQSLQAFRQAQAQQFQPVPLVGMDGKPITDSNGNTISLPANHAQTYYAGQLAAAQRLQSSQLEAQGKIDVANINQGMPVPITPEMQKLLNLPEGTTSLPLNQYNKAIGAATKQVGFQQGATGPYAVNKLTGQATSLNIGNPYVARAYAYAQAKAQNTPYQTVIPGTNIPTTVSQAQALKLGLPQVNVAQIGQIGGTWAIYNDIQGVLGAMKETADKVNLDDPGVKAHLAAALSAETRAEAEKGNIGGALQKLYTGATYGSLSPEEQTLATLYLQGKAGIIGMRKIMGQAGASDVQRSMDAALFAPGGIAQDRESLKRGLDMTQSLLGRYSPGLVQAGLNAPGTPTAINKNQPTVQFREGNDVYNIPANLVQKFTAKHPKAVPFGR